MAIVTYSCTKCKPIDKSILEVYIALKELEDTAYANEDERVAAEEARVEAETARAEEFALLHEQAGGDHSVAEGDHTRAEADHATASADHENAVADRNGYDADHTAAVADHAVAASDHTRAEADHARAEADHTRTLGYGEISERDHARAEEDHEAIFGDHSIFVDDHNQYLADHATAEEDHTAAVAATADANEAADLANAKAELVQDRLDTADADHARAVSDHSTAASDHTRAASDHTTAQADHTAAASDHTRAASDHSASDTATAAATGAAALATSAAELATEKAALVQDALDVADADHTRAESDHTTASSDHATAASDHTQASADHTQAGTDHTLAQSDHSTAYDDHALAEIDHSTAGTDHTRAENDHATAASDHTASVSATAAANAAAELANTKAGLVQDRLDTADADHTRAEADHTTAASDHTTAAADHTTAGADHTQALADHATAASDHTTAAADHTTAGADHTQALADHAIAENDHATLDEKIAHKADIDGSYDGMAVGIARNLEGRTDVTDSFFKRTTGGDAEVANGTAQLNEVKGKSQVWNQLVQNGNFADGTNHWTSTNVSASVSDGVVTINPTTQTYVANNLNCSVPCINGHKYYIAFEYKGDGVGICYAIDSGGLSLGPNAEFTARKQIRTSNGYQYCRFYPDSGNNYSTSHSMRVRNIRIIDLTLLGIDNLETVEEVEAWLAENIGEQAYYPYNPGEVLNNRMTGVESIGFNLLDPATGKADIIGAYSDVYGDYYGITGTHGALTFTDKFGNTETITPDEDGKFLLETAGTLSVADAGEDCAVFLWWDGTQTEFKQYEKNVGALDVTHIYGKLNGEGDYVRVWPTGMPGIGDIKDSLKVVDGQVVAERKVGEVDLGTLPCYKGSNPRFSFLLSQRYNNKGNYVIPDAIIVGYSPIENKYNFDNLDGVFTLPTETSALFADKAHEGNTAEEFREYMSGRVLYYELLTPQVYTDLIYRDSESFADGTPVTLPVNYKVDNWGIERIAPQNTEETVVTTKPELTMRYSIDAVEELNTHRDEIDDLYEKNEELDQRKPEKYGEYPDMAVGSAKNISGDLATDAEFKFRKTGGNDAVASGLAKLTAVYGKSLVWNQQVVDASRSGSATHTGSSTYLIKSLSTNGYIAKGHRMLIKGRASLSILPVVFNVQIDNYTAISLPSSSITADEMFDFAAIANVNTDAWHEVRLYCSGLTAEDGCVMTWENVVMFDLTLMFGAGNEPATPEEFEAMFPLPYYDYNAGEIISNKAEAIETTGFNQWDEEWELGAFNTTTGANVNANNQIRCKNKFPVFGNTEYFVQTPFKSTFNYSALWCMFFDKNENIIDATGIAAKLAGNGKCAELRGAFVTPEDAAYMRFYTQTFYGATYNHDICINLSDASRNGEYEPYRKYTLPLNIPTLTGKLNGEGESVVIVPEGLKSAGSVRDELVIKNGYATSVIKRVGIVDLGSLSYGKSIAGGDNYRYGANVEGKKSAGAILCEKYAVVATTWGEGIVAGIMTSGNSVYIFDPAYNASTAAEFKSAMDGVLLYYELATPEEYILDEPFYVGYQEDANGTEKRLPEDTAESVMPAFPCKIAYPIDVVKAINELGNTYVPRSEWAKWGVVSQTQTWSGSGTNPRTYTMSNKVIGWIPNSNIDLYEAAGAVYNPTTGYFELNGLTDISYAEMKAIYALTTPSRDEVNKAYLFAYNRRVRTIFPTTQADRLCGSYIATTGYVKLFYTATQTNIEVFALLPANSTGKVIVDEIRSMLSNNYVVKNVIGILNVAQVALMASTFANTYSLESVSLFGLKVDVSFAQSPNLTLASVVFAVQNCATIPAGGITITLHATAFARCQADTTEYTYNEQTYTGIIALAAAKNITIQQAS